MVKMVILLDRKEGWSFEEFREYWLAEHAPLVEEMPNVQRYVTSFPTDPERADHDGMAELYFEDMAVLSDAFDSEAGQAVQADGDEFSETVGTLYVEEEVQFEAE
jgi:uncharacterized protein (TIGR02118 family)